MAGLISFARGTVATLDDPDLRSEFRAVQLLTFTVISRCCSPGVQIALRWCREYLDAGHRAWHFMESTYQAHFVAPTKQGGRPGQRGHSGGGGGSSGWKPAKDVGKKKSTKDSGQGGGSRRRECWLCGDPDHLSFECPDRSDSDDDDAKGGRGRSSSHRPRRGGNQPRKETQSIKSTSAKDADSSAGGKARDDITALCSLVGVVEPSVSLVPEAGEDFQAVAAAVQVNPAVVLLDSSCSHHLMGTKEVFVDLQSSGDIKHVRGFNGALQDVQGRSTVALQGEAGKQVLITDVLYVPGVQANLLSAGQLKENGVKLQEDDDGMLLVSAAGEVLGRETYSGHALCTNLHPCSTRSTSPTPEVVALRAIVSKTKSTPDRMHARLAHVGMDTIRSSAKNEVAIGLDLKSTTGPTHRVSRASAGSWRGTPSPTKAPSPTMCWPSCTSTCEAVAKKLDVLLEFQKWLVLVERQTKKSVLMLRSDRGGEFLGKKFTDFVDGKGIVHDLTCPYTPQQNGMAETDADHPADRHPSTATLPLLAKVGDLVAEDAEVVRPPSSSPPPPTPAPPLVADLRGLTSVSASGDEGSRGTSPSASAKGIAGGRRDERQVDGGVKSTLTGEDQVEKEHPTWVKSAKKAAGQQPTGEQAAVKPTTEQSATRQSAEEPTIGEKSARKSTEGQQDNEGSKDGDDGGDAEESTKSEVVEVRPEPRKSGRLRRPPDFFVHAAFTTVYDVDNEDLAYDDAEEDEGFSELDPDMHADPEHRWDISTTTVKEALASWKGPAVKAAMEEEIRSLINMGTTTSTTPSSARRRGWS
ncbi:unnamed protein product [Closterium sp. Naga37s-1]|nr:unnamed protein product [Closterium sp. Naga37s-1]